MSDTGRLYAFGPADGGRLGFVPVAGAGGVSAPRIVRAPCLVEEIVVAVAGGEMHSACVCASGKVGLTQANDCGHEGQLALSVQEWVHGYFMINYHDHFGGEGRCMQEFY